MFEYDQQIVDKLLEENDEFRSLYEKHQELNQQVDDADVGVLPLDDLTLHRLKKEKLQLRDRLATLIEMHRQVDHPHPAAGSSTRFNHASAGLTMPVISPGWAHLSVIAKMVNQLGRRSGSIPAGRLIQVNRMRCNRHGGQAGNRDLTAQVNSLY